RVAGGLRHLGRLREFSRDPRLERVDLATRERGLGASGGHTGSTDQALVHQASLPMNPGPLSRRVGIIRVKHEPGLTYPIITIAHDVPFQAILGRDLHESPGNALAGDATSMVVVVIDGDRVFLPGGIGGRKTPLKSLLRPSLGRHGYSSPPGIGDGFNEN